MHVLAGARGRRDRALPGTLHARFGAGRAHGLHAGESLDQHAVARGRFGLQPLHRPVERTLERKTDAKHERQHERRDQGERSDDEIEDREEDDRESEIGDGDHRARSEELADRVEVAQLVREDADRLRPLRHLQRHDVLEDVGGKHDVDLLAGHVDDPAADHAKEEVEDDRNAEAESERDQGRDRAVRDHAIVHVHDEDRRRECDQVHDERRDRDMTVVGAKAGDDGPEPVRARQVARGDGARIRLRDRAHEERVAGIFGFGTWLRGGAGLGRRIDDLGLLRRAIDLDQNTGRTVPHDEDGREHERRDIGKVALDRLGFEAGALRRTRKQLDVELAVADREPREQSFAAQRATMACREIDQRIGERIGVPRLNCRWFGGRSARRIRRPRMQVHGASRIHAETLLEIGLCYLWQVGKALSAAGPKGSSGAVGNPRFHGGH